MTEDEATEIAWNQNVQLVQDAKNAVREAIRVSARTEQAVARACARRRLPTDAELARIAEARAQIGVTREAHEAAKLRFKAGVTPEQLAEVMDAVR